mmetsp:Transcript_26536/g.43451  ORF Transcript_26536/g.43451 Transcript_26536/m.43451 type:complete len:85 (+) Transcript_26536:86-340(+)
MLCAILYCHLRCYLLMYFPYSSNWYHCVLLSFRISCNVPPYCNVCFKSFASRLKSEIHFSQECRISPIDDGVSAEKYPNRKDES